MRAVRLFRLALIGAAALALAGCGASDEAASGGAEIVPANAPAFVTVDTDADSGQWSQIEELLEKFPDGDQAIRLLRASLRGRPEARLGARREARARRGDRPRLARLQGPGRERRGDHEAEGRGRSSGAAVKKGNASDPPGDDAHRRRARGLARPLRLAGEDRPLQAAGAGRATASPTTRRTRTRSQSCPTTRSSRRSRAAASCCRWSRTRRPCPAARCSSSRPAQRPEFIAAAFAARGRGHEARLGLANGGRGCRPGRAVRVEAAGRRAGRRGRLPCVPRRRMPGQAAAAAPGRGDGAGSAQGIRAHVRPQARCAHRTLQERGRALRAGGHAVPRGDAAARGAERAGSAGHRRRPPEATPPGTALPGDGAGRRDGQVRRPLGFAIRYAAFDGKVVVTTGPQSIEEIRSGGPRLADDDAFKSARDAAGMPDETAGFVWLDVEDGLPLVVGLAEASGGSAAIPQEFRRNLEPLRSLVAWADATGARAPPSSSSRSTSLLRRVSPRIPLHVRVGHRGPPGQDRRPDLGHRPRRRPS